MIMDVFPAAAAVVEPPAQVPAPRSRPPAEPMPEIIVNEKRQMSFARGKMLGQVRARGDCAIVAHADGACRVGLPRSTRPPTARRVGGTPSRRSISASS